MPSSRELGEVGETIAVQALETHKYTILERNWHWQGGEADLIAREDEYYVLVEVKLRRSGGERAAEYSITPSKKKKLLNTAYVYMTTHNLAEVPWRIDVVAIDMTAAGKVRRLAVYRDAVRAEE